jgi:hypothetical protein
LAVPPPDPASTSRPSRLRRIDDSLVPGLQRLARNLGRVVGAPARGLRAFDRWFLGGRPARAVTEHRGLAAFLVVALAFGAVAVHAQRYPELRQQARQQVVDPGPGDEAGSGGADGEATASGVGPLVSARVDPYLASRRDALAAAPGDETRVAVVSFGDFLEPSEAADVVDGLEVQRVLYQLPERTPRPAALPVEDGLVAAVDAEIDRLVAEIRVEEDEVASTLESGVEDDAFRSDYEARADELKALRNALQASPAIVFAVVVAGPVEALREVADRDVVRLVDLAPPGVDVDATTFHGVLPTDDDRFTVGRGV